MAKNNLVAPVLKWVGGKRQLLETFKPLLPKKFSVYCEPFLGGGAVFFSLQPRKAYINDINEDLMRVYEVIRDDVESLIAILSTYKNESDFFYAIRDLDRDKEKFSRLSEVERAARIIYLNKTCFNGLYRVNNAGEFNSPFGSYRNPNIVNAPILRAVNKYLNSAENFLTKIDYADVLSEIPKNTFVYLDPPYAPVSTTANFTGYTKGGFNQDEQIRLRDCCNALTERGIKFMLSNSDTQLIHELYEGYKIIQVKARRIVNSVASKRGDIDWRITDMDAVWEKIFAEHEILSHVERDGYFRISAAQIKKFHEPQLMTKFDHKVNLPKIFSGNELSILPVTRDYYLISHFETWHNFEPTNSPVIQVTLPEHLQSLTPDNIVNEKIALNCALAAGIVADFTDDENIFPTAAGHMSSGTFDFKINDTRRNLSHTVHVNNLQIEFGTVLEGIKFLSLIEANLGLSDDFLIQRLYYPYRSLRNKAGKPIKPVVLVYLNGIFYLREYAFAEPENYNSIVLVKQKRYARNV